VSLRTPGTRPPLPPKFQSPGGAAYGSSKPFGNLCRPYILDICLPSDGTLLTTPESGRRRENAMWAQTVMTCGSAGRSKAGQASETGGPRLEPAQWAQAGGAIRPVGAAPCRIKQRIAELCATPPSRFVRIPRNPTTHTDGIRPPTESDHLLLCPRHLRSRRRVGGPQPLSRSGRCFRLSPLGGLWFICLPERGGGRQLSERWSVDIGMGADLEPARAQGPPPFRCPPTSVPTAVDHPPARAGR